jgi:CubicO group peptidase (beta-lactamase class C family)
MSRRRRENAVAIAQRPTVLPFADPASLGVDPERIDRLDAYIERQIAQGHYPGAQFALARHGQLAAFRSFGQARLAPGASAATEDTLWLMYSQTKVITAAAVWRLVEQGAFGFDDRIAEHVPEFAAKSKGDITLHQVLSHQAGYPAATVTPAGWTDHELMRRQVCDFELQWWPGTRVHYHGAAAHWTCAVLIEAVTGRDYREFIRREVLDQLGLDDLQVGVPDELHDRCADMHTRHGDQLVAFPRSFDQVEGGDYANTPQWRRAGAPGAGGYGTAAAITTFYQMLLNGGALNGTRLFSPRLVQFVTRNHTGDRIDENFGMPMHRGLGPHVRGTTPSIRGLGGLATPSTFGHGGAGSSYSFADPESGLSFTYLSNCRSEEPFHSRRMDQVSNLAHATLVEP